MTDRGTIGEVESSGEPGCFCWTIPNRRSLYEICIAGDFYCSPKIQYLDNVWKLLYYPRGLPLASYFNFVQVYREVNAANDSAANDVRFTLVFIHENEEGTSSRDIKFDSGDSFYSHTICLQRTNLMRVVFHVWIDETKTKAKSNELASSDNRTEVLSGAGGVETRENLDIKGNELASSDNRTEDLSDTGGMEAARENLDIKDDNSDFRKHLEDMLLSGNDHDVTIKVKDQHFRAHKCMLRARSPVFAAMFEHKMMESTDNSISIDDCDPESFDEFLHYVYTDKVRNLSLSNAVGLYYAGDKYDFAGLKKICVEFLKASLSTTVIGDVISLAIKHGEDELLKRATEFFANHMEEIVITPEWQRFTHDNPIQANELSLNAVKTCYKKIK